MVSIVNANGAVDLIKLLKSVGNMIPRLFSEKSEKEVIREIAEENGFLQLKFIALSQGGFVLMDSLCKNPGEAANDGVCHND